MLAAGRCVAEIQRLHSSFVPANDSGKLPTGLPDFPGRRIRPRCLARGLLAIRLRSPWGSCVAERRAVLAPRSAIAIRCKLGAQREVLNGEPEREVGTFARA